MMQRDPKYFTALHSSPERRRRIQSNTMNPTEIYAFCSLGIFLAIFLANNVAPQAIAVAKSLVVFAGRTIGYRYLVNRHRLLGPWTIASVLAHMVYLAGNIATVTYGVKSWTQAAGRAGNMGLVNMAPLFLGTHLSFISDALGIRLESFRRIHRSCGLMAAGHMLSHGVIFAAHGMLTADNVGRVYALTVRLPPLTPHSSFEGVCITYSVGRVQLSYFVSLFFLCRCSGNGLTNRISVFTICSPSVLYSQRPSTSCLSRTLLGLR